MDSIRKVFGYHLRKIRGDRTQEVFSGLLGIPLRSYQKMENGNVPQKKKLKELVDRLNAVDKLGLRTETQLFQDPDLSPPKERTTLAEEVQLAIRKEIQAALNVAPVVPLKNGNQPDLSHLGPNLLSRLSSLSQFEREVLASFFHARDQMARKAEAKTMQHEPKRGKKA